MGRVGRVGAESPARRHDVDGRLALLHHTNLHRRRVRAQHDLLGLAQVHEDRVEAAPRWMPVGDVERLEVVPSRLDLRALGHRVTHPHEHILKPLACLSDRVKMAAPQRAEPLGEIESLRLQALGADLLGQSLADRCGYRLDTSACRVETPASLRSLRGVDRAEASLGGSERGASPQKSPHDGIDVVDVAG